MSASESDVATTTTPTTSSSSDALDALAAQASSAADEFAALLDTTPPSSHAEAAAQFEAARIDASRSPARKYCGPNLVWYLPCDVAAARRMLELAAVTADDVVYDLGCGDARILIEAARTTGARCRGVDVDVTLVKEARTKIYDAHVEHLVTVAHQDFLKTDFSDATVVCLFLTEDVVHMLEPRLRAQLRPGARIVCHFFNLDGVGWTPIAADEKEYVYVYRVEGDNSSNNNASDDDDDDDEKKPNDTTTTTITTTD